MKNCHIFANGHLELWSNQSLTRPVAGLENVFVGRRLFVRHRWLGLRRSHEPLGGSFSDASFFVFSR